MTMNKRELYDFLLNDQNKAMTKLAIVTEKSEYTYAEFQEEINQCVGVLKKYCKNNCTKIGLKIGDHASFLTVLLAGYLLEATIVPIYVNVGEEKKRHIIDELNINILISDSTINNNPDAIFECMQKELYISIENDYQNDLDDDVALIMLTSGTTNKSKGVMLTTENISTNIKSINDYLQLVNDDHVLIVKNTNHISTIVGEMLVSIYAGVTLVFNGNIIQMNNIEKLIEKYKVTVFFAVPYLLQRMLLHGKDEQNNLRIVNFYGAKISESEIRKLLEKYPKTNFIYSYGQTEASPRVTYIERNDLERFLGSSGRPINGVSVTIQDELGNVLGAEEEGEIVVSGPNIMRGYYKNKELTEKTIIDGQLHTKDLGYLNKAGYLFVTGRKDNMIIISGKNIHPEEIEGIISEYVGVEEVLVEEKKYGGISGLICYIVKTEGYNIDIKDLLRFVRSRVEDYKTPREIVFVPELEKTSSGKIRRKRY